MAIDYKEKICKLLALAESPNEHEARAALLKARELMAEHKLTERELKNMEKQPVERLLTDITCSKRRHPWIIHLSITIGENYCCKAYIKHVAGKQTFTVGFIGLKDDAQICNAIFRYAVDCVLSKIKLIRKEKLERNFLFVFIDIVAYFEYNESTKINTKKRISFKRRHHHVSSKICKCPR